MSDAEDVKARLRKSIDSQKAWAKDGESTIVQDGPVVMTKALALIEQLQADARRYRWLRECHWSESNLAVVMRPKKNIRLGAFCPSREQLDDAIDAAISDTTGESE